jgi:hypothetical protein
MLVLSFVVMSDSFVAEIADQVKRRPKRYDILEEEKA